MYLRATEEEERLLSLPSLMRQRVEGTIREGLLRAVPEPVDAQHLAEVHTRLLQRIRAMELALQEFEADLRRVDDVFGRAEQRTEQTALELEGVGRGRML